MTKSNLSNKKPLVGNKRSHSNRATKMSQKPNMQTKKIDGVKVTLASREWKTMKKDAA